MNIYSKLEILLITYNREKHLKKTFEMLFSDTSPIKNLDITVLDNCSTDGTSKLVIDYQKLYPNLKYIRHNHNIGGNANIARAFEMGRKDYIWVLCDDDYYDWSNWSEVEKALLFDKFDLIFVAKYILRDETDIAQLCHQATFVPGCIYSRKIITDNALVNMSYTMSMMFPQSMLSVPVICSNLEKVFIPKKAIVLRIPSGEENSKTIFRGQEEKLVHPEFKRTFWHIAFIKAIQIIQDKKKRDYIVQNVRFTDVFEQSFYEYMLFVLNYNRYEKNNNVHNIIDLYCYLNNKQRLSLTYALFSCYFPTFSIKNFLCRIFSVKNSANKKHKVVCLFGFRISIKNSKKYLWKKMSFPIGKEVSLKGGFRAKSSFVEGFKHSKALGTWTKDEKAKMRIKLDGKMDKIYFSLKCAFLNEEKANSYLKICSPSGKILYEKSNHKKGQDLKVQFVYPSNEILENDFVELSIYTHPVVYAEVNPLISDPRCLGVFVRSIKIDECL